MKTPPSVAQLTKVLPAKWEQIGPDQYKAKVRTYGASEPFRDMTVFFTGIDWCWCWDNSAVARAFSSWAEFRRQLPVIYG